VAYQKKVISVLLCRVTLKNLGHINIASIIKRLSGRGEGSQPISSFSQPGNFLFSCGHSGNFLEISVIVPSSDRKRIPPWANAKLPYIAWENCSGQNKGLFLAQNRKITMTTSENRNFCYSSQYVR
jgi:hypothetical protein